MKKFKIKSIHCVMMPVLQQVLCIALFFLVFLYHEASCRDVKNTPSSPKLTISATKGMVIDAGSGGSRLHVYSWKPRIFETVPPPLSFPESDESWTVRISPGINELAANRSQIEEHLSPLLEFAKRTLKLYKNYFQQYPIYFYATGGMRELPLADREAIMDVVRNLLNDDSFCPFYFRDDFARIISGEEEAIYSWAAVNFLKGTLLPASEGLGIVTDVEDTYGTLDLGGASTQIAFFVPSQDISEGLYKLQIGGQKQWNVYTKSFLTFGVHSARRRHCQLLADSFLNETNKKSHKMKDDKVPAVSTKSRKSRVLHADNIENSKNSQRSKLQAQAEIQNQIKERRADYQGVVNYCFHAGYSEIATDSTGTTTIELTGPQLPQADQLARCIESVKPLMEIQFDAFCNRIHHGDCSIAGSYQPPLPKGRHGHFIGTSTYALPWRFLMLPDTAPLDLVASKASAICQMNFNDILFYYETNRLTMGDEDVGTSIPYFCFLTSYVLVLLQDGYNFEGNQTVTVIEEINGNKVSWTLGAILYEINELPWTLKLSNVQGNAWGFTIFAGILGCIVGGVSAIFVYREIVESRRVQASNTEDYDSVKRIPTAELVRRGGLNSGSSTTSSSSAGRGAIQRHTNSSNGSQASATPPGSVYSYNGNYGRDASGRRKSSGNAAPPFSSPYGDSVVSAPPTPHSIAGDSVASTTGSGISSDWLGSLKDFRPFQKGNKYTQLPT